MKNRILSIMAAAILILTILAVLKISAQQSGSMGTLDTIIPTGNGNICTVYFLYSSYIGGGIDSTFYTWSYFNAAVDTINLNHKYWYTLTYRIFNGEEIINFTLPLVINGTLQGQTGIQIPLDSFHQTQANSIKDRFGPHSAVLKPVTRRVVKIKAGHSTPTCYDLLGKSYSTGLVRLRGLRVQARP